MCQKHKILWMHSCVTNKNVKWCHLIWPTLYVSCGTLNPKFSSTQIFFWAINASLNQINSSPHLSRCSPYRLTGDIKRRRHYFSPTTTTDLENQRLHATRNQLYMYYYCRHQDSFIINADKCHFLHPLHTRQPCHQLNFFILVVLRVYGEHIICNFIRRMTANRKQEAKLSLG